MMRLAGVLARQDHELIVWAPHEWRDQVTSIGARFELSSPEIPRVSADRRASEFAATTERETERLIPELHAHDVDLLIRDSQTPWALVAGSYLGLPRIVSHPVFPLPGSDDDLALIAGPAERERFERSWLSIARRWGVELGDVRGLYHRTSEPTLVFTTEEIVGGQELPPTWRCIGPLLPPPAAGRVEPGAPLVYACFGTARNRRTELFKLVVDALAGGPVQLVISGGGRKLGSAELGPLPSNVELHAYADTPEMLARARVHVTHAGCNSVHESLVAGVPMVCLPQAFDQIPLSRRVEQLGAGVVAAEDPDAVAQSVLTLLQNGSVRARIATLSERLRRYDGEGRVAAAIEASL